MRLINGRGQLGEVLSTLDITGDFAIYHTWNFIEKDDKVLGICFDFTKVQSVYTDDIKWTRLQRLDFPFKQHMIESYGKTLVINPGECGGWLTGKGTVALVDLKDMKASIVKLD